MNLNFTFGIMVIIFLLFLWMTIDYRLGRRKHLSQIERPNASKRHGHLELFNDGENFFENYFEELKRAKKHIHILFYIAKNDRFSTEFFHILTKKAKEGVEVRLMLDRLGSNKVSRQCIRELKEAGGQFTFSQIPKFPFLFYSSQTRNHRKITVIDGVTGYIGGFNVGKEYVNQDEKLNPWRDYHIKMMGEGIYDLQTELLKEWKKCVKIDLLRNDYYFPKQPSGPALHQIIPSEGDILEDIFLNLISSAKNTILIGSPYFIPSQTIFHALLTALNRGVKLKILVPQITDHILVKEASFPYLRRLMKEGAQVYQFHNGFYHAKTLMIDDQVCDIGTANFDKRSFFLNYEINCYIYDKDFIKRAKEMVDLDFKDAKILTLEEINQPNLWRSFKETIAKLISYFL